MDRTERFYKIDQLLQPGRPVAFARLQDALGVSKATLKRDLEYMRSRLNAPIEWDREARGYRFVERKHGPRYELPGLWFSPQEAYALLAMQHLLVNLQPGLLEGHVEPLLAPQALRARVEEKLRAALGRYAGAELGNVLEFGRGKWKVVGIFDADGSSFESEVWVDVRELANDAKRPFPYSGIRLRAATPSDIEPLQRRINDDPRFAIEAQRETDYYAKQSESANSLYVLVIGIAVLAGIAWHWSFILGIASGKPRPLAELRRLDRVHGRRRGTAGDSAEGLSRAGEHTARIHVPGHDEKRVVGKIVAIVEGAKLARIDALDITHPADDRPSVGMRLVGGGEEFLGEIAVGVVLGARSPLLGHHLSL